MENIFLKQLVRRELDQSQREDLNAPFSFIEWRQRRSTTQNEDAISYYNQYVVDWFNQNKDKTVSQKFLLRQKYLYLLSQLQLFFSNDEKHHWYNKVNLSDEKELLLSIPYFAKKLKNVALYYLKLRKKLKNTKLKYNLVGTETGLQQEIQNRLLEVFSSLNTELPPEMQNNLPTFEDLQQNLTVQIEQLYDDSIYFDKNPNTPLSGYYDIFHATTAELFATKGLTLSSSDWIFNSFNVPVTANLDAFVAELTGNIFEQSDANLYGSFIQKFLAESKYATNFDSVSSLTTTSDIQILSGSNYFFYPTGVSDNSLTDLPILPIVSLSSIVIPGATSSKKISGADIMYVESGGEVKGAWLKYNDYVEEIKIIDADLEDPVTSFIFPFPGYGLSAEDVDWTGPSLSSTQEYKFLTSEVKGIVDKTYWSQTLANDKLVPILLNNTTLISSGAYANKSPNLADKIYLKERSEDTTNSLKVTQAAWLYKFDKTYIPVSMTASGSAIMWPLEYINADIAITPPHLDEMPVKELCAPVSVSDLYVPFAVASDNFENAEKIYKLQKPNDSLIDAVECCWLYGRSLSSDNYTWNSQGGFSALFSDGEVTKFVWGGPNNAPLDYVFGYKSHAYDCPFYTVNTDLSSTPITEETDPNKCTCKSVYYSPFGHNGNSFTDFNSNADYIAVDTANDLDPFDIGSWRDSLSGNFEASYEFAWYKTNAKNSWGDGKWTYTNPNADTTETILITSEGINGEIIETTQISATNKIFSLQTGKTYFYKRTTSKDDMVYPPYIVNFQYPSKNTSWIEAKKTRRGGWVSTDRPSNMKLYAGDIIKWGKQPSTTFYHLTSLEVENIPLNTNNNAWTSHDVIPLTNKVYDAETIIIWPAFAQPLDPTIDPQFPLLSGFPITFADVVGYHYWKITRQPTEDQNYRINNNIWTTYDSVLINYMPLTFTWPITALSAEEAMYNPQYPSYNGEFVFSENVSYIHWWKVTNNYIDTTGASAVDISYSSDPVLVFAPMLSGTYTFEVSARLISDEDFHFTDFLPITARPLESYYSYNSTFATFAPYTTGTYSVEVSAIVLSPTSKAAASTYFTETSSLVFPANRRFGENYYFTNIPLISVVSPYSQIIIPTEQKQPTSGYLIIQPLSGISRALSSLPIEQIQRSPLSATPSAIVPGDVLPYWAVLDLETTNSSSYGSGYPKNYIDGYLPDSAPKVSPISLNFGNVVDYHVKGLSYKWIQPLKYSTFEESTQWSEITSAVVTTALTSVYEETVLHTTAPTTILLTNVLNGKPVKVTYNAKTSFVWQISYETPQDYPEPTTSLLFNSDQSWNNLSNRFYPTIAVVPTTENLYAETESGGFFTSSKLGASQYINDNFTVSPSATYYQQSFLTEDISKHVGGRGLTKSDQETIYKWDENNQWLKEPSTANELAGAVKKSLTKSLQTFVPYQNSIEQKQSGFVTPTSRVSPWGGPFEDQWTDTLNEPKGFTGVRNVSAWGESQVLKQNQKVLDNWVTDIYGNQYGLFKSSDLDASLYHRAQTSGQMWVRTNDQIVNPAYKTLSALYEPFRSINSTVFEQLTGDGITNIDCFFDTLMIQTSSIVLYSKIRYNYDTNKIESFIDNTRFKFLTNEDDVKIKAGQTWFFTTEKKVYSLYTTISSNQLIPELYELSLTNNKLVKQFPYSLGQETEVINSLNGLSVASVDVGLLTYCKETKQVLMSLPGKLTNGEQFLVEIILNDREDLNVESITIYTDTKHPAIPFTEKITVTNDYFYDQVPFEVDPTSTIVIPTRDPVLISISAINDPTYFEVLNFTSNVTAANDGTFTSYFENTGLYQINYKVGNEAGYNLGCLTLSAVNREDVILLNGTNGFLVLNGYNGRFVI